MTPDFVDITGLSHRYRGVQALADVDVGLAAGELIGVVGPDGVGKSTLLSIIAGVTKIQNGMVKVFGGDMANNPHRKEIRRRLAFMPQGLGQNLYGDLTVEENIRFFASLFEVPGKIADARLDELLEATELSAFSNRRAADLSGGMKQKLGLCAALIHGPSTLILDEPTTGVDPLSRRNFWKLIRDLMQRKPDTTVLVATAYLDEADDFDRLVMMDGGRIFATGTPDELKTQARAATLDEAYQILLSGDGELTTHMSRAPRAPLTSEIVIEANGLTRRFGDFTAVDGVNFQIRRGEIYGFIGPNGCGKTTTMKMLTGLLPPSDGTAEIFGSVVTAGDLHWLRRLGYMSQQFSLYSELTVEQNLTMHGQLFDLPRGKLAGRVAELAEQFELVAHMDQLTSDLPVGIRQRLSLAVAIIHGPELLILDEPTSGVDPLGRDKLWTQLRSLSDELGTTIFVSTHYLGEAARCDRVALMNEGRLLVDDKPEVLLASKHTDDLEDAFIAFILEDRAASQDSQQLRRADA
jgi:ribosome-dependent ATPase